VAAMRQADAMALQRNGNVDTTTTTTSPDEVREEILYVMIPTDTSRPLQQLIGHLQSAFTKKENETIDIELLRQQQTTTTQLLSTTSTSMELPTVSDTTLRHVAETMASVETFTVVHPTPTNHYISIVLYLDEVGLMKRLPLNTRATDYCARAGYNPPPIFYGTVYMGRLQQQRQSQQRQTIQNRSFRLGPDTSYDAPWLQSAILSNIQHQQELNQRSTGQSYSSSSDRRQQANIVGSDGNVQIADGYTWTQTEQELEVTVTVPNNAITKLVTVKFQPLLVTVLYDREPKIAIPLFERVDVDACTWTLDDSNNNQNDNNSNNDNNNNQNDAVQEDNPKRVIITMEKVEEAYWPRIRD
jgi:CS domain